MLPKSEQTMLEFPKDWRDYTAGAIATDLVSQAGDRSLQAAAWRYLIGSALQGLVEGWAMKKGKLVAVIEEPNCIWRINDVVFFFLPEIGYESLGDCVALGSRTYCLQVLTPPRREDLLYKVLAAMLGDRRPTVSGADTYLSFRNTMDQGDFGWTREAALLRLLSAYNKRISLERADESLLVNLPAE